MSDSVRPHRWQPTRLPRPWDSPGKNTGVGCHFLLQCVKVKSESEVAQSCLTLSDPMDCSLPGSSVHGYWSGVPLPSPKQPLVTTNMVSFMSLLLKYCIVQKVHLGFSIQRYGKSQANFLANPMKLTYNPYVSS